MTSDCGHAVQFPTFRVDSGVAEVSMRDALPCAHVGCPRGIDQPDLVTVKWRPYMSLRPSDAGVASTAVASLRWERVRTIDGWRWSQR